MNELKLTIELVPKGAWGNNLRTILSDKDWEALKFNCYNTANGKCAICGYSTNELDAHEVWEYDIKNQKQTLKNIVALCSKCHGVKHFRNSERLGYGENAKSHFMSINKCDTLTMANHIMEQKLLFEERNKVLRWKIIADIKKFGGEDIEIEQQNIPLIISPYDGINIETLNLSQKKSLFDYIEIQTAAYWSMPPSIESIKVDNYQGIISVVCFDVNKIEWYLDNKKIQTKYNVVGKFKTELKVKNICGKSLYFKLFGSCGTLVSKTFELLSQEVL